ncbi:MAG: alpha-mannosidase [Firmicutes bacterium]|nr:alpha-mannosidase [Bacillota bacterium]
MNLTREKLRQRIDALESARFRDRQPIPVWRVVGDSDPSGLNGIRVGDVWSGRDRYLTISATAAVPQQWRDREVVALFNLGRSGDGNNSGFEALLWVNDTVYQGVDSRHREVWLPRGIAGQDIKLTLELWSGLEGGGEPRVQSYRFDEAALTWCDPVADDLYLTARAVWEAATVLGERDPIGVALLTGLDRALTLIDWRHVGSAAFDRSLAAAQQELTRLVGEFRKEESPIRVSVVGHCHIDVAWLWRLKHTRKKAARSFATALRLMEHDSDFVFFQSQPQLYAFVKEDQPELYQQIRERVREGRWEADGAMWLESDTNLPSGESLVRQILFGTRFLQAEFGVECRVLWLPDAFGYSAALPQILAKAGIEAFVTSKISWNQSNRMPHDTFWWRGIDGSRVLAYFLTAPEANRWDAHDSWFATYNAEMTAGVLKGTWDRYQDKAINRDVLLTVGYGDGGGGPTRDMLALRQRFDALAGLPACRSERVDVFLERLRERVAAAGAAVATWDGELYLEYHRGTYTSQGRFKRAHRRLELALREAEWLATWAYAGSALHEAAQRQINQAWQVLLRNEFHDILPGSSIHEVYQDAFAEVEEATAIVDAVAREAASGVTEGAEGSLVVFNSAPWPRSHLVRLPLAVESASTLEVSDGNGTLLAVQRVGNEWWIQMTEMPGLNAQELHWRAVSRAMADEVPFSWDGQCLVTPRYHLEFNEEGQIRRWRDLETGREIVAGAANAFQVFEDKPLGNDAWDIDAFYQQRPYEDPEFAGFEVVSLGPIAAVIRGRWRYCHSTIEQDLIAYRDSRRVDFRTRVSWHEQHQLLKVAFPVTVRSRRATYQIQFGHIERPTHRNTSWDAARFEVVGHQWADLSEYGFGVSLLNDGKYGYDIAENVMRLSLIKSATYPDYAADQGEHEFTYAILPHAGDLVAAGTVAEAWDLNQPLWAAVGRRLNGNPAPIRVEGDHVHVAAIKKAEDGEAVVVRVYEYGGGRAEARIMSDRGIREWRLCDLRERPLGPVRRDACHVELKPFEIATVLVWLKS